ncbi:MAG: metallophosphoesterase [Phycisphaerae bacterium]|nr:metallophosphoesterase [Phycisphaerae bacterium]
MRVCFTSDLHGTPVLYDQLDALLDHERPALLILGGDLCIDAQQNDPKGTQAAFVESDLVPRLKRWRRAHPALRVAAIPGNHEWVCTWDILAAHARRGLLELLNLQTPLVLNGLSILGYGCTPPTPFWAKDFERLDLSSDDPGNFDGLCWDAATQKPKPCRAREFFPSQRSMEDDFALVRPPPDPWVLVAHAPPYGTQLDRLPHVAGPVGSRAVRAFVERSAPCLSLHGHIHESPSLTGGWRERVGRTLCVNPGQEDARLHAVVFSSEDPVGTLRHNLFP